MNQDDAATRGVLTRQIYALLQSRRGQWVSANDLAKLAFCSWRTRVSDARAIAARDDCEIVWNGQVRMSAYMLRPKRLGRDASERLTQKSLFG